MRVFIAVELPEHVRARVFHEFENLQKKNLFKGKFVEKNNLHLTLHFIGEISEERVEEIKKILKEVNFPRFLCNVGKVGFFNSEKHIKVIWVGLISKEDNFQKLQKEITKKFPEIKSQNNNFFSHITIARVNSIMNKEELVKEAKRINFKKLDFGVDKFVLMKSELMKEKGVGPQYKVLEEFKLK